MATDKSLHGDTVSVPETDETNWGAEVSAFLSTLIEDAHAICWQDADGNVFSKHSVTTTTLADSATLTPATNIYRLAGTSGAITLDGTTAITDGEVDGQILIIKGTSDTNTVTINDGANTQQNGNVTLADGDTIEFWWDSTGSEWQERSRNN
jgi:hypothetical protein